MALARGRMEERGWVGRGRGGRGGEAQGQRECSRLSRVRAPSPTLRRGPAVQWAGTGGPCLVSRDRSPAESEHGKPGPPLRGFPSNTGAYPSPRKSRVGGVSKSYFMKVISERFEYAPVGLGGTGGERSFPPSDMLLASFPLSRLQLLGVGVAGRQ